MTKQDYIALAKIIKENSSYAVTNVYDLLPTRVMETNKFLDDLCQTLKADNPRFDEDKFRKACE